MPEDDNNINLRVPCPINLEAMSQDALRDYILQLEQEIARVRRALEDKEIARAGAESLFKK
jgi:Protein of unknown function (DUF1192).